MEIDRPGPGEELNPGAVTVPRVAASVIVLRDSREGPEVLLVFPTIRHLQELTALESVEHALSVARSRRIQPVEPRVVLDRGGVARVLMPGEPGYDDAAAESA